MVRKQTWLLLALATLIVVLIAWFHRAPDPGTWPRCEYFRCLDCSGPASIDPSQPERWGCRACRCATFQITGRFRVAVFEDFRDGEQFWEAQRAAGVIAQPDPRYTTPATIWFRAGGHLR